MNKNNVLLAAALVALASCSKSLDNSVDNSMQFCFEFPGSTKATETDFEAGDTVALYGVTYVEGQQMPLQISGNWINNEAVTFDGSKWTSSHKIVWPEDSKIDFYAYYPYNKALQSVDEQEFSVAIDQSTEKANGKLGGYESSDLLWANLVGAQKQGSTADPVKLSFKHICSRIVVKLEKGDYYSGSFPSDAKMAILNTVPDGFVNFEKGSVSRNFYKSEQSIVCKKIEPSTSDGLPSFEAILIPQKSSSRRPFIELCAGKTSYLVEDNFNFKPGMSYTYTLVLNSSPDQVVINIGGHIEGWN